MRGDGMNNTFLDPSPTKSRSCVKCAVFEAFAAGRREAPDVGSLGRGKVSEQRGLRRADGALFQLRIFKRLFIAMGMNNFGSLARDLRRNGRS